jgi:hypothetical protein
VGHETRLNLNCAVHYLILRDHNREPASFRANVKDVVTLLVKSKTRGKASLHRMFEGQRDCLHAAGDPHSYGVGD